MSEMMLMFCFWYVVYGRRVFCENMGGNAIHCCKNILLGSSLKGNPTPKPRTSHAPQRLFKKKLKPKKLAVSYDMGGHTRGVGVSNKKIKNE